MTILKITFVQRNSMTAVYALALALAVCGPAAHAQVSTYYVAPDGNDSWSGTLPSPNTGPTGPTDGPFATLNQARLAVRADVKTALSQVTVELRDGTYFLAQTAVFTAMDSGTSSIPIIYRNYRQESPVISGGVRVQGWTNVSGNVWQTMLVSTAQYQYQYFEQLFYNGERRLRPRLGTTKKAECDQVIDGAADDTGPNKCRDLGEYLRVAGTYYAASSSANCSVQVTTLPPPNWECFDRFYYETSNLISGKWKNLNPPATPPSSTCDAPNGSTAPVGDIELLDFEKYTASKLRISCVDSVNQVIYLTGPTSFATQPTAHGFLPHHRYLIENVENELKHPGQWFLDCSATPWTLTYLAKPGENPNTDTVIIPQLSPVLEAFNLQYVTFQGLTFEHDNYTVPFLGHADTEIPYDVSAAVSFQNSQNITFDSDRVRQTSGAGLEFLPCTNGLLATPQQGFPLGGSEQPFVRCLNGIINPMLMTANNEVKNSAFYDLGEDGVRIGIQSLDNDSVDNVPQFVTVENNVVEGYGRVFPNAWGISQGDGHDNIYRHNDVYDGYHTAIGICQCTSVEPASGGAYDNTISFNHVYNLFQGLMNDAGSLYIASGNAAFAAAGNKILNNKVHDVSDASALDGSASQGTACTVGEPDLPCDGYGGHGIYLDTQTGLVDVENNLVYRVSDSDLNFPMTPPAANERNKITNNIFAFARLAAINDSNPYPYEIGPPIVPPVVPPLSRTFVASSNIFYFDRDYASSPPSPPFTVQGGCTYSGGAKYSDYQLWESNIYWRIDGNFATDPDAFHVQTTASSNPDFPCSENTALWQFYTFAGWQGVAPSPLPNLIPGEDVGSVVQNPGFNNAVYPFDDYSLPAGSPGEGFVVFDPTQAGRSDPVINPPAVAGTFVTATFNPVTVPCDATDACDF
jgi:hypothetical protein